MSRFFSIILFIAGLFFIGGEAQAVFCKIKCGLCQHNRGFESCLACHKGDLESLKGKERNCWAKRQKYLESQKEKLHQLHSHLSQVAEQVNENKLLPPVDPTKTSEGLIMAYVATADNFVRKTEGGDWVNAVEEEVKQKLGTLSDVEKRTELIEAKKLAPHYKRCLQQYVTLRQSKLHMPRAQLISCLNTCEPPFDPPKTKAESAFNYLMVSLNLACFHYYAHHAGITQRELSLQLTNKTGGYTYGRKGEMLGHYKQQKRKEDIEIDRHNIHVQIQQDYDARRR